jgi:protein SCO1/2
MSRSPLYRLTLATVLAAIVLGLALGAWFLAGGARRPPEATLATLYPSPRPLPEFALLAHDGSRFDRSRLTGHWTLLFLGFTQCPDVCPATLTTLAAARRALRMLPEPVRPAVVLVSVDPSHDTPAVLAAYVPRFDPAFVGATGEEAALAPLARALGAYVSSADDAGRVTHSGAVYLIDPQARIAAVYTTLPAPLALAADYRRVLRARGGA